VAVKFVSGKKPKNKLISFVRNVLRKIFGPTNERDWTRRIKTHDELDELLDIRM